MASIQARPRLYLDTSQPCMNLLVTSEKRRNIQIPFLVCAAGVAVLVVLDEGQESVDGRRALDDVLDAVILRAVFQNLLMLGMDFRSEKMYALEYTLLNRKTVQVVDPALLAARAARDQPLTPFFCSSGYMYRHVVSENF